METAPATAAPKFLFFMFIMSIPILCASVKPQMHQAKEQIFHSTRKERMIITATRSDFAIPDDTSGPGTFSIPQTPPAAGFTPMVPAVTNPVTSPTPTNPAGGGQVQPPVTDPGSPSGGFPGGMTTPVGNSGQQSWCVAKNGAAELTVQAALDYACGSGADCSAIQQGGACYNPNTLQSHASYAFNSYYQKNPASTSCDFGGAAAITNSNPSTGSCVFPTSSSSSSSPPAAVMTPPAAFPSGPATAAPATFIPPPTPSFSTPTTPTNPATNPAMSIPPPLNGATPTSSSGGVSPNILNASGPGLGGFTDSPANTTLDSMSPHLQPSSSCFILLIVSIITLAILVAI